MKKIITSLLFIFIIGKTQAQANLRNAEIDFLTYSGFICFGITLVAAIILYIWARRSIRKAENQVYDMVALPKELENASPAVLAYAHSTQYDDNTLGITLLDLAIKGFVQFKKKGYELFVKKLPKQDTSDLSKESEFVLKNLFAYDQEVNINDQEPLLKMVNEELVHEIKHTYNQGAKSDHFYFNRIFFTGLIGLILSYVLILLFYPIASSMYFIIGVLISLLLPVIIGIFLQAQLEDGSLAGKFFFGIAILFYLMLTGVGVMAFLQEGKGEEFFLIWLASSIIFCGPFLYENILCFDKSIELQKLVDVNNEKKDEYIDKFVQQSSEELLLWIFAVDAKYSLKWKLEDENKNLHLNYDWLIAEKDEDGYGNDDEDFIDSLDDVLRDIQYKVE